MDFIEFMKMKNFGEAERRRIIRSWHRIKRNGRRL